MRIIIASSSERNCDFLRNSLKSFCLITEYENNAAAVRRKLSAFDCDIVLIDSPLCDEFGNDLAVTIAEGTYASVILTVRNEMLERAVYNLRNTGVLVIGKPLSREILNQTINTAISIRARLIQAEKKTMSLNDKLEELKCVNRAKLLLMQKRNMSEDEAHHFIEKLSMDNRTSKKITALDIIKGF